MSELAGGHPCFNGVFANRLDGAVRISDFMTVAKFKQTAIYNEFFRYLGTDRQIVGGLHITASLTITCSLCRLRKDFTERDRQLFNLLTPHLAAFRGARFIDRLKFESEQFKIALESAKYGIVFVDKNLRTKIESPIAAKFLRKYFKSESAISLPDQLHRYVKYHLPVFGGDEFYLPPVPLEIKCQNAKLKVRLIFHQTTQTVLLLLEEIPDATAEYFRDW